MGPHAQARILVVQRAHLAGQRGHLALQLLTHALQLVHLRAG